MRRMLLALVILSSASAFADGAETHNYNAENNSEKNSENSFDARHDKRLPPVIPGEEVKDGKKTIKMWSTSGVVESEDLDGQYDDSHVLEKIDDLDLEVHHGSARGSDRGKSNRR